MRRFIPKCHSLAHLGGEVDQRLLSEIELAVIQRCDLDAHVDGLGVKHGLAERGAGGQPGYLE